MAAAAAAAVAAALAWRGHTLAPMKVRCQCISMDITGSTAMGEHPAPGAITFSVPHVAIVPQDVNGGPGSHLGDWRVRRMPTVDRKAGRQDRGRTGAV